MLIRGADKICDLEFVRDDGDLFISFGYLKIEDEHQRRADSGPSSLIS